ncbi:hypothetical protein Saga11_19170 [Bacillus safensis]|nr:hypothetical protein Saga11_19170 [Bacillus safensis]
MIGTKSKWSDIVRYICKFRAADYKLSIDLSGVVHIADHEPKQLEDELELTLQKKLGLKKDRYYKLKKQATFKLSTALGII